MTHYEYFYRWDIHNQLALPRYLLMKLKWNWQLFCIGSHTSNDVYTIDIKTVGGQFIHGRKATRVHVPCNFEMGDIVSNGHIFLQRLQRICALISIWCTAVRRWTELFFKKNEKSCLIHSSKWSYHVSCTIDVGSSVTVLSISAVTGQTSGAECLALASSSVSFLWPWRGLVWPSMLSSLSSRGPSFR